jgi:peptidoglycan/LPS O-acetylase OafA/YrhL
VIRSRETRTISRAIGVFATLAAVLTMPAHGAKARFQQNCVSQDRDDGDLTGMRSAVPSDRFGQIDALRGVAALLVVWLHAVQFVHADLSVSKTAWAAATLAFIDPGRVGVVLFFAISGFVIPSSLKGSRRDGTRTFLIRRFFRLYPVFWVSILAALLPIGLVAWPASPAAVAANFSMIPDVFGFQYLQGVYWTLEIELIFYAICLLLFWCRLVDRAHTFIWMVLIAAGAHLLLAEGLRLVAKAQLVQPEQLTSQMKLAVFALGGAGWFAQNDSVFLFLSIMATGTLCRFYFDGKLDRLQTLFLTGVGVFWLCYPAKALLYWAIGKWTWGGANATLSLSLPVLLFMGLGLTTRLTWRPMVRLGLASYSLYLFHLPVVYVVQTLAGTSLLGGVLSNPVIAVAVVFALAIGVAALGYAIIERPAIALAKFLAGRSADVRLLARGKTARVP